MQNWCLGVQFYHSKIDVLQKCLAFLFVSVAFEREKLRELRENKKHKIRALFAKATYRRALKKKL